MSHYKRILVAIGLGHEAEQLLNRAKSIAAPEHIYIAHIEEHPVTGYGDATGSNHSVNEMNIRQSVYPTLCELADRHRLPRDHIHIAFGDPGAEVHTIASRIEADLIVTGSHGKHGLKRFLSSTSSSIHDGATRDVLSIYTG
ncbi:universal stress protein [Gilvimarinus agarilyticus]|uniref:universal stress protein n=1 Tax=Gilvimarinus agarilyticus TaxID=679259 RepID=UPI0005A2AA10|nr:universal stress protein [Gilvimarinus agarilyticus]